MNNKSINHFFTKGVLSCGAAVAMLALVSCEDQIMEWGTPDGRSAVTKAELPLEVKEVLANYDNLKAYAPEGFTLGLGFGAPLYVADAARKQLADDNFQMLTWGNAMKHDAMISNTGKLSADGLETLDAALDAMPEGMLLYGHNFFWHTQQNQTYLKSLIKPTLVVESDSDIKNMLAGDASDFDGGTTGGWGSWGSGKVSADVVAAAGPDGSPAMVLVSTDGNFWEAQFAYTFDTPLSKDVEYTVRFKAKSSSASGQLQFQYQNSTSYGSQGGYTTFDVGTDWTTCETKFTITDYDDVDRIILNFGSVGATYTIDNIEFGEQQENSLDLMLSCDFETGDTEGWGSWGSNKADAGVADGEGSAGSKALMLKSAADGNFWEAQCAYTFTDYLAPDAEYTLRFKARSLSGKGQLQFQYQNSTSYGSQGGYTTIDVGSSWTPCEVTFTPAYEDVDRIILNFGAVGDTYYIDDIEMGTAKATDPMTNILVGAASDFEGGESSWGSWGSNKEDASVQADAAHSGSYGLMLKSAADGNFWEAQCAYTMDECLTPNSKYIIQFYAKSDSPAGALQFQHQNSSTYGSQGAYTDFEVGTDWVLCQAEFSTEYEDVDRIIINFGKVGATYYIDDIKFGLATDQTPAASRSPRRAAKSYYVLKTDDEKRTALIAAMEQWVKDMAAHLKEKGITPAAYDVINEGVADGSYKLRGIDNVFAGSDQAPVESTTDGLELNWESGHFYWGYWVKDYGVRAFQLARQYLPAETKLFINDYNLETSPGKLAALIEWVKQIDAANGSPIVDGIGTQMHIGINPTDDAEGNATIVANLKEQIDAQFQTLAATGKLIRITELDVDMRSYDANGERTATSSPSAAQYKCQADVYKMIIESYLSIIPKAQQHGITIWSLTDQADEHEYWLTDGKPNLFDEKNLRKWAYKGAADGLAGEDLGLKYGGEDYKAYYERQNVSETVK